MTRFTSLNVRFLFLLTTDTNILMGTTNATSPNGIQLITWKLMWSAIEFSLRNIFFFSSLSLFFSFNFKWDESIVLSLLDQFLDIAIQFEFFEKD